MTRTIQTERLLLRPYATSDAAAVTAQIGDFEVSKWLTRVPYPYAVSDALDFFARVADLPLVYAVCRADDLVGCVSVMDCDLGYWYGATHWGQGYATEAARAAVGAHFAQSDVAIDSGYLSGNGGSQRVLEKLGFTPNGEIESECLSRQLRVPNHRMRLTRTSWEAHA